MFPRDLATAVFRCWRVNTALLFLLAVASTQAKTGPGPGTALSFDGVNGVVGIGAAPLPVPWTAEFWVNRQVAFDNSAILLGDAVTALKLEQFQNTRRVGFTRFGVGDYLFNYTAPTNTWVHLAFVSDTSTRLYVDRKIVVSGECVAL